MAIQCDYSSIGRDVTVEWWASEHTRDGRMVTNAEVRRRLGGLYSTADRVVSLGGATYYAHCSHQTEAMIVVLFAVGVPALTEKNAGSTYGRIHVYERVVGATRIRRCATGDEPWFITPEEVRLHVGLETNAPKLTVAQFRNRIYTRLETAARMQWDRS